MQSHAYQTDASLFSMARAKIKGWKNMKGIKMALGTIFVLSILIGLLFVPCSGMCEDKAMEKWMQEHTVKVNSTATCKYEQGYLWIKVVYTGEGLKERFGIEQFTKKLKMPVEDKVLGMQEGEEKVFVTEKVTVLTSGNDPPHWWDNYTYPQWTWFKDWWSGVYEQGLPINLAWENTTKDMVKSEILEEYWYDSGIVAWTEYVYDPVYGWVKCDHVADAQLGILGRYHAVLWQMSDGNVVANAHHDTPVPHKADKLEEAEELVAGYFAESDDTEWSVYEDSYDLDNEVITPYSDGWCTQIIIEKEENEPPIALFTYSPENPDVNQTITFNASDSYDPDGEVVRYYWDFGDEMSALDKIITHSYASAGNYTVTLTVYDDKGAENSTTKKVEVREAKPTVLIATHKPTYNLYEQQIVMITIKNPANISAKIKLGIGFKIYEIDGKQFEYDFPTLWESDLFEWPAKFEWRFDLKISGLELPNGKYAWTAYLKDEKGEVISKDEAMFNITGKAAVITPEEITRKIEKVEMPMFIKP